MIRSNLAERKSNTLCICSFKKAIISLCIVSPYNNACAYYVYKITYYGLEQCSKVLPIMFKLCSIYLWKPLYSTNSTFLFSYPTYITKLWVSSILLALLQYEIPSIYLRIISMNININTSSSVVLYCQLWSIHS